ncbi:DHA2 family efflux MFS transporter permease subunit [Galactobacter caseinivorans]|uniref:DHA2 family efflux MFS transporter permease subunit n=1 Tax=Galactobacter caseinivorans TaxID=2676123 RepID=UPI001F285419|nr:DHA2 family efflux MFS transporter permease subunit [Galactobacter caseinivorans]
MSQTQTQFTPPTNRESWKAMSALILGFFMILIDTTIVTTALPAIMKDLDADLNGGLWVTSAYLLTYAVPLLISGRLGDRFGPRNMFLIGLSVFTLASLWCGLADSAAMLIAARAVQGLGAALLTPQSMTLITRIFPAERRGAPMALWGATAGVATLVGPLLGGVLVDAWGWEWIFFVNIPVGVLCFVLVWLWVPRLPVHSHSFDLLGVGLSAVGIFLLVFGIQQGESHDWGTIWTPFPWLPLTTLEFIIGGLLFLVVFVLWQARNKKEPLLPLRLFSNRNFTLANVAITCMGVAVTTFAVPVVLYLQTVREFTPTQAALVLAPMSLMGIIMAPLTGKMVGRRDPKWMAAPGFFVFGLGMFAMAWCVSSQAQLWAILVASAVMGLGSAFVWPSVSFTSNRDLTPMDAGAGSGVFNTTRQVGAVIGSAAIAAVMQATIAAQTTSALTDAPANVKQAAQAASGGGPEAGAGGVVPEFLHHAFATAYGQSLLLPALAALAGAVAALCFRARPSAAAEAATRADASRAQAAKVDAAQPNAAAEGS